MYHRPMSITAQQKKVLAFIRSFQEQNGFPPSLREICAALGLSSPGSLIKHVRRLESEGLIERTPGKKRAWRVIGSEPRSSIPLVGRIAAGTPILAEANKEDDLPVDPMLFGVTDAFALRVQGDSMIDAHIREGDIAIIRPQADADDGTIVAVVIEGIESEATLKILRRKKTAIELVAANPMYKPLVFHGPDRAKVQIVGKLIGLIRRAP
ncbi:MAG: transcriptional repressor LexA [Desulfomonilaceae bacterium]